MSLALKLILCLAISNVLLTTVAAAPTSTEIEDESAPERGQFFEGDMIEPFEGAFSGLINSRNRWPNGIIVYKWDSSLSSTAKSRTEEAMVRLTRETGNCIRFREATSSDGSRYVLIRGGSGCSATVGYYGRVTYVNLSSACSVGNIMHEFQHSLGIYHQHSRPDRDGFVRIALENVQSGYESAFRKLSSSTVSSYGTSYDFGSQMHYPARAFSKNGRDTIVPLPGKLPNGIVMGQRQKMSNNDIRLVKAMYNCR